MTKPTHNQIRDRLFTGLRTVNKSWCSLRDLTPTSLVVDNLSALERVATDLFLFYCITPPRGLIVKAGFSSLSVATFARELIGDIFYGDVRAHRRWTWSSLALPDTRAQVRDLLDKYAFTDLLDEHPYVSYPSLLECLQDIADFRGFGLAFKITGVSAEHDVRIRHVIDALVVDDADSAFQAHEKHHIHAARVPVSVPKTLIFDQHKDCFIPACAVANLVCTCLGETLPSTATLDKIKAIAREQGFHFEINERPEDVQGK